MGPNEYMAKNLMEIKSETELMYFLTTMWVGKYVMLTWDKFNGGIMTIWGAEDLEDSQIALLSDLVWNFISNHESELVAKVIC
jgi:hypothetical protein